MQPGHKNVKESQTSSRRIKTAVNIFTAVATPRTHPFPLGGSSRSGFLRFLASTLDLAHIQVQQIRALHTNPLLRFLLGRAVQELLFSSEHDNHGPSTAKDAMKGNTDTKVYMWTWLMGNFWMLYAGTEKSPKSAKGQVCGESKCIDEQQGFKPRIGQGHLLVRKAPGDGRHAIDDEDQAHQASKNVLAEHGHVLHRGKVKKNAARIAKSQKSKGMNSKSAPSAI